MTSRKRYLELEAQAEMKAVLEVGSTSFEDILKWNNVPLTHPSKETTKNKRGEVIRTKDVTVRGQDVANKDRWNSFLKYIQSQDVIFVSLTDDLDQLSEKYYTFLVDFYTPTDRYHNLDMDGKLWLRKVVRLAVKYHLMKNKVGAYKLVLAGQVEDDDQICEPLAAYLYELVHVIKQSMGKVASLIYTIVNLLIDENNKEKRAEIAAPLIRQFFDGHYQELKKTPFPQRDAILRLVQSNQDDDLDTSAGEAI